VRNGGGGDGDRNRGIRKGGGGVRGEGGRGGSVANYVHLLGKKMSFHTIGEPLILEKLYERRLTADPQ